MPSWSSRTAPVLIALLLACGAGAWSSELEQALARGDRLIAEDKAAPIQELVAALAAREPTRPAAILIAARAQIADGLMASALATLSRLAPTTAAAADLGGELQVAYGETLRRAHRLDEASAVAERVGARYSGLERAWAAELVADVAADRHRWGDALGSIQLALATLSAVDYTDEHRDHRLGLERKRTRIQAAEELLAHGLGFQLYRDGNAQRLQRHLEEAAATFARLLELHAANRGHPVPDITGPEDPRVASMPIADVYAAAARVYRGRCLMDLQRYDEARRELVAATREEGDPFAAEAWRLLGDLELDANGDARAAAQGYTAAVDALARAVDPGSIPERFRVPTASRVRTAPPAQMRAYAGWGNLDWFQPRPEQVIDAETCDWYVGYQTIQAQTQRALCRFLLGDTDGAIEDLDAIDRYDSADRQLTRQNQPSNYLRLRDDFRHKRLYATSAELSEFSGRALVMLARAEVLFETEQWDAALAAYARLAAREHEPLSRGGRAYLDYARASALVFAGRPDEARPLTAGFTGQHPIYGETATYWRALFLLANLDPAHDAAILGQGAAACPDPSLRADFVMRLGQGAFCRGDAPQARVCFTRLCALTSAGDYRHRAAEQYLGLLDQQAPSRPSSTP
jgi:hypothetical protein